MPELRRLSLILSFLRERALLDELVLLPKEDRFWVGEDVKPRGPRLGELHPVVDRRDHLAHAAVPAFQAAVLQEARGRPAVADLVDEGAVGAVDAQIDGPGLLAMEEGLVAECLAELLAVGRARELHLRIPGSEDGADEGAQHGSHQINDEPSETLRHLGQGGDIVAIASQFDLECRQKLERQLLRPSYLLLGGEPARQNRGKGRHNDVRVVDLKAIDLQNRNLLVFRCRVPSRDRHEGNAIVEQECPDLSAGRRQVLLVENDPLRAEGCELIPREIQGRGQRLPLLVRAVGKHRAAGAAGVAAPPQLSAAAAAGEADRVPASQ
mmetsp:Transcript_88139/g.224378  ORF Transcript_88139/g.224378 Transcript_88139/m.224378 type:complete len:324 (+) Transcript_88139:34-1005(+)